MSVAEALPSPIVLNLGCGRDILPGAINVDIYGHPGVAFIVDLDKCRYKRLPFQDNYADVLILSHILEHLRDPLSLMGECHRVAKPNALLTVRCPYGSSDDAWSDQTHVRAYFLSSFEAFGQPYYERADYAYRGDWQVEEYMVLVDQAELESIHLAAMDSTNWKAEDELHRRLFKHRNFVRELIVSMRAVKPIRPPKFIKTPPKITFHPVKRT